MYSEDFIRNLTEDGLKTEVHKIVNNYMTIYDEYHSKNPSRDCFFLHDLVDSLKGISAVLEVYVRDKTIHPMYAVEKLKYSESLIKACKDYFESKGDENESTDR